MDLQLAESNLLWQIFFFIYVYQNEQQSQSLMQLLVLTQPNRVSFLVTNDQCGPFAELVVLAEANIQSKS